MVDCGTTRKYLFDSLEKIGCCFKYVMLIVVSCVQCLVDIQPKTPTGMPLIAVCGIVFSIALIIYSIGKLSKK